MSLRRRALTVLVLAASGFALAGVADGFQELPQQKLLDRACNLAAVRIRKVMDGAATSQVLTVQTRVRLLRPGRLAADIVFNPSGNTISVAADGSAASTMAYACGYSIAGDPTGSGTAGSSEGVGLPKRHVVSELRERIKAPGRYALTFTINQKGQRILARLGARQRAYRKRHPPGHSPPSITWGVGIHFMANG